MVKNRRGRKNRELNADDLPNQARAFRLRDNLSLGELAAKIKVQPHTLSEFELYGKGLGELKQWALAEVLNTDRSELIKPGKNFADKVRQTLDFIR